MTVLNPFTNDARVLREAMALAQFGYAVQVIAVQDAVDTRQPRVERCNGLEVSRVPINLPGTRLWNRLCGHHRTSGGKAASARTAYRVPRMRGTRLLRFALQRLLITWRMLRQLLSSGADVYHVHDFNTLPLGVAAKLLRRRPLIYDAHEVVIGRDGDDTWLIRILERFCVRFVDRIITTTDSRAEFLQKQYRCQRPVVIRNVVDLSLANAERRDLHAELDICREVPIVLYQGGVQPGRGIEQVLASMPYWESGTFVVVGDGPILTQVQRLADKLGVSSRVRWVGRVPLEQLLGYTKGADIGLQVLQNTCFNHYSTDSNKLFEYFAAGIPVVAADYPEIRKVLTDCDAGLLIDPHNPKEIADAVNRLLRDSTTRYRYAQNARSAAQHYNWANEAGRLRGLYEEVHDSRYGGYVG